jgi:hypothetical protein
MDFDQVLERYDRLLERIGTYNEAEEDHPKPMLVMPDVVGNQEASLLLLKKYAHEIKTEADFNVSQPVVPIPKGELSLADAYKKIVRYLGTDKFIVGIPSVEKVVSDSELRDFLMEVQPQRIHFLGAVKKNIEQKLRILAEVGLDPEHLSADANILRSALYGRAGEGMTRAEGICKVLGEHGVNPTPINPSNVPNPVNRERLEGVKPKEMLVCMACGADKGTERARLFDLYRGKMEYQNVK